MRVVLASKSPIKADAVRQVYGSDMASLVCVAAESGVPSQPVGRDETKTGANGRLRAAQGLVEPGSYDMIIAMENGIWEVDNHWVDGAVIVVYQIKNDDTRVAWSETLQICHVPHCRVVCNPKVKVKPGRDGLWSALKDPHAEFGKPRVEYLRDALQSIK